MRRPIAIAILLALSTSSFAAVSDEQFQSLMDQMTKMNQRLDSLEQENSNLKQKNVDLVRNNAVAVEKKAELDEAVAKVEKHIEAASWPERLSWSGDLRPRYEYIDAEGKDSRNRLRVRARAVINAQVTEGVTVGIGIASGSEDPVSSNQSIGKGGSTKGINLDLAYVDWKAAPGVTVGMGKFKNPISRVGGHSLLWDSDWRPEGINLRMTKDKLFLNSMANWFEADSKKKTSFSYMLQGGINLKLADNLKLKLGAGYFSTASAGHNSYLGDGNLFGNSLDPVTGKYLYDYDVLELFGELAFSMFGMPVVLFADVVHNSDAAVNNDGYAAGFRLGKVKKPGSWDFRYAYQDLEADATLGLVSDSDFGGGGTDVRGHIIKAGYGVAKNWTTHMTYIHAESNLAAKDPRDFDRLQLDLVFKFK